MKTTSDRVLTKTFTVGVRFTCTLTIPLDTSPGVRMATAEWSPHQPENLSSAEIADYQRGLNALISELGNRP